jgi:hypothetical protein
MKPSRNCSEFTAVSEKSARKPSRRSTLAYISLCLCISPLRKTELIRPLVLIMISYVPGLILPPLKVRRVLDTVTFLFKLFHNKVDCSTLLNGLFISVPQISSRSHRYFYVPRANTNILNNSPSFKMCSIFNCFNDICDLHTMPLPSILAVIMCNLDRLHRLA